MENLDRVCKLCGKRLGDHSFFASRCPTNKPPYTHPFNRFIDSGRVSRREITDETH